MGLCDFLKGRTANKEADRPMVEDGEVVPDITIPTTPGEAPPQCTCYIDGEGLRWRDAPVVYWIDSRSFGEHAEIVDDMVFEGFQQYRRVSRLQFIETNRETDANIRIYMRRLDGMNGTLGVAYQAAGSYEFMGDHKTMSAPFVGDIIIDLSENWSRQALKDVLLHEIGHALGMPHIEDPRAVMNPYYVGTSALHPLDVKEVIMRYDYDRVT